jgi:hypothetical protein
MVRNDANCLIPETVTVYASGTNRLADIRGAVLAGVPIGVDVSKLSQAAINEIVRSSVPVFLDSGAFGEVTVANGELCLVAPISIRDWKQRLAKCLRIADAFKGSASHRSIARVTAVAPDQVGSQEVTLERLSNFRSEILALHATGADILVPVQVGRLGPGEFFDRSRDLLGIDIVPGMPMKKSATTPGAVLQFALTTKPRRLHLLGMGITNKTAEPLIRLLQAKQPRLLISLDSNRIRAAVGKRRDITAKEHCYRDELVGGWSGEVDLRPWGGELHDLTECLFRPSSWLTGRQLRKLSESLSWLSSDERKMFLADPEGFLSDDDHLNDWMYETLMQAYHGHITNRAKGSARTAAVAETFDQSKIGAQVAIGASDPRPDSTRFYDSIDQGIMEGDIEHKFVEVENG